MLTRPDSADFVDIVADGIVELVRAGTMAEVTVRALGGHIGVTGSALIHRYGSRDRVLSLGLGTVVDRWCAELVRRSHLARARDPHGARALAALLPEATDLEDLPVWIAIAATIRSDPAHRELHRQVTELERDLAQAALEHLGLSASRDVDLVVATVGGLRGAIGDPDAPLPLDRAHEALARLVDALRPVSDAA